MNKTLLFTIVLVLLIGIFLFYYLKKIKNSKVLDVAEVKDAQKIFKKIKNLDESYLVKNNINGFSFEISSVVHRGDLTDFMITFENNSLEHIRIEIKKISLQLFQSKRVIEADFKLNELTMGTNDILLKNTVLKGGNLVRNALVKSLYINDLTNNDSLTIELNINGENCKLYNTLRESYVTGIEIIN